MCTQTGELPPPPQFNTHMCFCFEGTFSFHASSKKKNFPFHSLCFCAGLCSAWACFLYVSPSLSSSLSCSLYPPLIGSSGVRGLEALCLQVTDLLPGLRRMRAVLPEHGCLLVSPGNYWQNQQDLFDSDPDLLKTVQKHEPKVLHTSATLRGEAEGESEGCRGREEEVEREGEGRREMEASP